MPVVNHAHCNLHYERHGTAGKPALVFAHGAGGNAMSWWQQVPVFADDHDIITFDHRGFGKSVCAPEHYDMGLLGADLHAILVHAGISRTHVVCQSMGGWSGTLLAAAHPDMVDHLVLGNTPGAVVTDAVVEHRRTLVGLLSEAGGLIGKAIAAETAARNPALAFLYAQIADRNPPRPDIATQNAVLDDARLAAITARIDIISSDLDPLFPPHVLQSVADRLGARLHNVSGCGHSTYFELPDTFNSILRGILAP